MSVCQVSTRRLLAIAALAVVCVAADEAAAQVARYTPRTPTLSPYLGLTRRNRGGFPNYFAFTRPAIRQQQQNLQQEAVILQQQRQIMRIGNEIQRGEVGPSATGSPSWFLAPGNTASFLDTSSYFPEPKIPPRR